MNIKRIGAVAAAALLTGYGALAFEAVSLADYSGEEIFGRFCASCHGDMAHGDGPVAVRHVAVTACTEAPEDLLAAVIRERHGFERQGSVARQQRRGGNCSDPFDVHVSTSLL